MNGMKFQVIIFSMILVLIPLQPKVSWGELWDEEKATIQLFENTSPSVVFIKNASIQWDWFSGAAYEVPRGVGSGFVWDINGHIITNFHVINGADKIEINFSKDEKVPAKIIGISPEYDLAVLKCDMSKNKLKPVQPGDSSTLKVGQKAISIGNPFGLDYSLTIGVISSLGRSMKSIGGRTIHDVIQTDAAINPGNSGGPLLDSSGKLIGVATAIYSPSGANAGVGFAIPVNTVKRIIPQLIKYGKLRKVGLGVRLLPEHLRLRLGIKGAMILDVYPGSAAEKADLQPTYRDYYGDIIYGDIIVSVDDKKIEDNEDVIESFEGRKPGERSEIEFLRDNKKYKKTVILQELR